MAKYEARVKTNFGEIVVNFDSTDDFEKNIESLNLDAVSNIVLKKFGSIIVKEPRKPKPGLEGLYRFTPEGKVELLKTASSAPMTIGLLLYASDPEPMSSEELLFRGIKAGNYVSQTDYRKYFDKTPDDRHVLTQPGRQWVESEIIPKLIPQAGNQKTEQPSK
jgi:hypothetical protein